MDGLRNEQPVERISMKSEQIVDPERVPEVHRKHPDGVAGELIFEVGGQVSWHVQFPHTRLYGDLPAAGRAKENLIGAVRDRLQRPFGESRIVFYPPQENVSIE